MTPQRSARGLNAEVLRACEGLHDPTCVAAVYLFESRKEAVSARARALALEESTGSWLDLPYETKALRDRFAASVKGIYHVGGAPGGRDRYVAIVEFPGDNIGPNLPLLLSYIYGGISGLPDVRVLDIRIPTPLASKWGIGPRFGVLGLRHLCGREDEPLLLGIVKPCVGLNPAQHASIAGDIARGGADLIKDDELLVDQSFSPIAERCRLVREQLDAAREGGRVLYFANVTAGCREAIDLALVAKEHGADGLLVSGYATGLSTIREVGMATDLPIALHPALAGSIYQSERGGIDERVVFGRLPRFAGADVAILFGPFGKFRLPDASLRDIVADLRDAWGEVPSTFPAFAAGVHPGQVHRLVERYGKDIIIVAGGSIVAHPSGPESGARAFRQAIAAAVAGVPLDEAVSEYRELREAVEIWGGARGDDPEYDVLG